MANAQLLASKIVVAEEEPRLRGIPAEPTAIIAACGVAERGPLHTPTLVQSWEDYLTTFGGFILDGDLPLTVYGIFRQDPGASVWVTRTCHYTDITNSATAIAVAASVDIPGTDVAASAGAVTGTVAAPFNLSPGDTLDIHVDEDAGGPETVTFDAAAASVVGTGLAITDISGETVILEMNNDGNIQTMTFLGSHAGDPDGAAAEMNAQLSGCSVYVDTGQIRITSDLKGTDSEIDIQGGTALTELGLSVGVTVDATSDVANIDAVTFAEVAARIAADVTTATVTVTQESGGEITLTSDTTGVSSSVQVEASSTADTAMGFDNDLHSGSAATTVTPTVTVDGKTEGTYAEDLRIVIAAATNGLAASFNLSVQTADGIVLEIFPNLTIADDTAEDFVDTVVNAANGGSNYIATTDAGVGYRPDNGTYTPTGGDDGLTGLDDNDFLGDSAGLTGIHAFDNVQTITLLIIPGRATAAVHQGMVVYCESDRQGECFAILDPPAGYTAAQMVTYQTVTAALKNLSEHGAIYWPQIKILNPSKAIFGTDDELVVPPSGWVAGVISRVDASVPGGVYLPPAGIERGRIYGCLGFETDDVLREEVRDLIYPERINPIATIPGFPRFIDGVWTLKSNGNFPSIAERRGASYIERVIKEGLQFARHSNNDEELRARAYRVVYAFLLAQMQEGAFRTTDPETAFFVDFSEAVNPPSVINQYKMVGRIGLATQKPAEYIVLLFSQDTRAIEEELAG